ncbi:hypothetical protein Hanom_Chr09g00777521 [Helianthus anomalus]
MMAYEAGVDDHHEKHLLPATRDISSISDLRFRVSAKEENANKRDRKRKSSDLFIFLFSFAINGENDIEGARLVMAWWWVSGEEDEIGCGFCGRKRRVYICIYLFIFFVKDSSKITKVPSCVMHMPYLI